MLGVLLGFCATMVVIPWTMQVPVISLITILSVGLVSLSIFQADIMTSLMHVDNVCASLIILTLWLTSGYFIASQKTVYQGQNGDIYFSFVVKVLNLLLLVFFLSESLFSFYFFFEAALIPTFFLVIGWGYQPERLQAGLYLMLYTVVGSLPLLICIAFMSGLFDTSLIYCLSFNKATSLFLGDSSMWLASLGLGLALTAAFMFKLPVYGPHIWLPKAHVEAPVAGSMVLAGVLLKLGGYGLLRIALLGGVMNSLMDFLITISLWGGLLACLVCLTQVDMKSLVAYSSVGHMSFVAGGVLAMHSWGCQGALLVMIAHGFCSAGLFALCGYNYEVSGSRSLMLNKSGLVIMPSLCLWWALFCCCNMSCPPSLNLLGELLVYPGLFGGSYVFVLVAGLLSFLAMGFSMYLFSSTQHGDMAFLGSPSKESTNQFSMLLISLWVPINFLIFQGYSLY